MQKSDIPVSEICDRTHKYGTSSRIHLCPVFYKFYSDYPSDLT